MPSFSIHPNMHPSYGVHAGVEAPRTGRGDISVKISPVQASSALAAAFPTSPPRGAHIGSTTAHRAQNFTFRNDKNVYSVMNSLSTPEFLQLGIRDPRTGVLKQASITMSPDGHGGWKRDNGVPGGGQGNTKHASDSTPLLGSSSSRSGGSTPGHSFSNRSGWGNSSTASPGAAAGTSPGRPESGWNNPSTGSPGAPVSASSSAPPVPPRNTQAGTGSSRSDTAHSSGGSGFGPVPDKRYVGEPGDGKSKYWRIWQPTANPDLVISVPADSSIDAYARPKNYATGHPSVWYGQKESQLLPPK